MAGSIIENLSGRKLTVLIGILLAAQLSCFLLGGLVAPAPTSVQQVLATKCFDKNYSADKWYFTRPSKHSCDVFIEIDDPVIARNRLTGDDIIFTFQIPLPRDGIALDYSRWQQNLIGSLTADILYSEAGQAQHRPALTLEARVAYRNKGDPQDRWTPLKHAVIERRLDCDIIEAHRKEGYTYDCSTVPLFELGSLHHDFYLLNLRLPSSVSGRSVNTDVGKLQDLWVAFINQNGGFSKVWVSLKSVFFPCVVLVLVWFWKRINQLSRPPNLLEYCIMGLGLSLSLLNLPLEYLTLVLDCPWMTLVADIRQGVFYASLFSFWLVFAGEHLMDDAPRASLRQYWRHLSAVIGGSSCLFLFDMCERGVQLVNPFYSIWGTETGTSLALAFIIVAGVCAGLYFVFLAYMIYRVFCNISAKRNSLAAMSCGRRLKFQGVIYRFKALMLATLLCAAMTVTGFILGQVSEGRWKWDEDISLEYTSAFFTGVYGMWNVYTLALLCLYAPSHKRWPTQENADASSQGEEIEFARMATEPSELSALTKRATN